jgi:hypothetical protein
MQLLALGLTVSCRRWCKEPPSDTPDPVQKSHYSSLIPPFFRCQAPITLAAITLLSLLPCAASALDRVIKGTFSNLATVNEGSPLFVSLVTPEGLVHFAFRKQNDWGSQTPEQHLQGYRRTVSFDRGSMHQEPAHQEPASFSVVGSKGVIYFRSRRRGRLSLARFSIHRAETGTPQTLPHVVTKRISSYRGSKRDLCGMPAHLEQPHRGKALEGPGEKLLLRNSPSLVQSRSDVVAIPLVPPRIVTIATTADGELFAQKGTETNSYIRTVLNAVDSLYTTQLGIRLRLIKQEVHTSPGSFVGNTAEDILESFRLSTLQSPTLEEVNVRHLFSGKDFLGSAIGLAFLGTSCDLPRDYNFSVSQSVNDALVPVLVAHEIAHNLNATHDPTQGSLMNPSLAFTDRIFSPKSLSEISTFVRQTEACFAVGRLTQVTLSTRIDPTNIFAATTTASSAVPLQCTLKLFGARKRSTLSTPTRARKGGKVLNLQAVSFEVPYAPQTVTIGSRIPEKPSGIGRFFFRSALTCGGKSTWSQITESTVMILFPTTAITTEFTDGKADRWLGALAKELARS